MNYLGILLISFVMEQISKTLQLILYAQAVRRGKLWLTIK